MEERDERKTMMLQALAQMELQPLPAEEEVALTASKKLPLGKIASLGVAFEPIMDLVQSVMGPGVQSQLYKVTVPAGGHLAAFRNGSGFLGAVLGANNQTGGTGRPDSGGGCWGWCGSIPSGFAVYGGGTECD